MADPGPILLLSAPLAAAKSWCPHLESGLSPKIEI
jgi:hypothetical protein